MSREQLPFVSVNVAMTVDGKIDSRARAGARISDEADRARVDRLRAESDAVLVGGRTLERDDPSLLVRSVELRSRRTALGLPPNPAKVAISGNLAVDPSGSFATAGPARRMIFTACRPEPATAERLTSAGVELFVEEGARVDLRHALSMLHRLGMERVLVEGGGTLIWSLLEEGLVDEISTYVAPAIFGGSEAPTPADGTGFLPECAPALELLSVERIGDVGGVLLRYRVRKGSTFLA